ncbi:hypothetical protein ACTL6P_21095 [Endozoicomonas acroporae]|uniref:hypothetical protein n=1 Tax=Endozoicomonas acroporae TaxID=1701104 RepID=UPI000C791F66|nr:hypothetical protein [Endozoicomonas acroporae]
MATPLSPSVTQPIYTPPAAGGLQTGQPSGPTGHYVGHNVGTHDPATQLHGSGTGAPALPYQQQGGQPPFSSVAQHPATSYMTPQSPAGAPTAAETAPATPEEAKTNGEQKAAEGEKKAAEGEKKAAEGEKKAAEGEQKSAGGKTLFQRLNLGDFFKNTRNARESSEAKSSEQAAEKGKTPDSEKSAEQKAPEKAPDQGAKQSAAPPAPAPAPAAHQPVSSQSPHTGHQQDPHRSAMPPYTPAPTHTPATPGNVQTPAYGAHPQTSVTGSTQHAQFDSRSVPPDSKESAPTPQRSFLEQRVDSEIQNMRSLVGEGVSHYGQQGPTRDRLEADARRDLDFHREQVAKCEEFLQPSTKPETQQRLTGELASQQTNEVRTSEQSRTQQTGQQSGLSPSLQDAMQEVFLMAKRGAIEGAREALNAQARGLEEEYGPLGQRGTNV